MDKKYKLKLLDGETVTLTFKQTAKGLGFSINDDKKIYYQEDLEKSLNKPESKGANDAR